jgi:hypothetical protein
MTHVVLVYTEVGGRRDFPVHLVTAPGVGSQQLQNLREQVDSNLSGESHSPIVTNFEVNWRIIGNGVKTQVFEFDVDNEEELEKLKQCHGRTGYF